MEDSGGDEYFCPSCGEPLDSSDHFCPQCGARNEHAEGSRPDVARDRTPPDQPREADQGWGADEPTAESDGWGADHPPTENGGWQAAGRERGRSGEQRRERRPRGGRSRRGRREPAERPRPPETADTAPPGSPGLMRGKEPAWKPVAVGLGLAGLSIGLLFLATLLSVPVVSVLQLSTGAALIIGAAVGQYFGFFGLALAYLRYTREFSWQDVRSYLGVRIPSLKEIGMVFVGYVAILGLSIIISLLISLLEVQSAENESANQLTESASADPILIAGVFALMFLVVGPCEEILYRGVIQNRIRERFSKVPGIIAASAIFASVHVIALGSTDPIAVLTTVSVLAVTALVLGGVYEYTGNLVVPWLLHSLHNSILVSAVFFGPDGAESTIATILAFGFVPF